MNIAQPATGSLNVGLEQIDGFSKTPSFVAPRSFDHFEQRTFGSFAARSILIEEVLKERFLTTQKATFRQTRANNRVVES